MPFLTSVMVPYNLEARAKGVTFTHAFAASRPAPPDDRRASVVARAIRSPTSVLRRAGSTLTATVRLPADPLEAHVSEPLLEDDCVRMDPRKMQQV